MEITQNEVWKDVKGYEGVYQISNKGNVKALKKTVWNGYAYWERPEKMLKPRRSSDGYFMVTLRKNGKSYNKRVNRLVAEAFVPNPKKLEVAHHIDNDITNNNAENLEWVSHAENSRKAVEDGLKRDSSLYLIYRNKTGARGKRTKVFSKQEGKEYEFDSIEKASKYFGYNRGYFSILNQRGGENKKFKVEIEEPHLSFLKKANRVQGNYKE